MAASTKLCLKRWMISITFDALNVDEAEIQRHVFWLYWWFKSGQRSPLALHSACGLSVLLSGIERWDIQTEVALLDVVEFVCLDQLVMMISSIGQVSIHM